MTKQQLIAQASANIEKLKQTSKWAEIENRRAQYLVLVEDKEAFITGELLKKIYEKVAGERAEFRTQDEVEPARKVPLAKDLDHYMMHFMSQMQISRQMFHPIEYAAICHKRILEVCPFVKYNELVADYILNLLLVQGGFMPIHKERGNKLDYEAALESAQHPNSPDVDELIIYITKCLIQEEEEILGA